MTYPEKWIPQPEPPPYRLESEQVVIAAPLSFAGSTRRIYRRYHPATQAATGWKLAGIRSGVCTLMILAWLGVLCWYLIFGLMLVPYRVVRRVQRNGKRKALRHEEILRQIGQR